MRRVMATTIRRRRWRRRLLRLGPILLLTTLLPSLLSIDHWSEAPAATAEANADQASHQSHCHVAPASCSDQPVATNARSFAELIELPSPELPAVALEDSATLLVEFRSAPPTLPPRF